jgi:tRNA 5-methylaminomethyl-2-thiouridine biosynthesis bifunctional protein
MGEAVTLDPAMVLAAWAPEVRRRTLSGLERLEAGWRLSFAESDPVTFDVVCLCAGPAVTAWTEAPLEPVRGQLSWSGPLPAPPVAANWGGYATPTREGGVLFGATHARSRADTALDPDDEARNLGTLAERRPSLAAAARAAGLIQSRSAIRAATPDRLPLAGALVEGLFVLAGLGGRGFTTAPLLAEHVAALALGAPSPLTRELGESVNPGRFQQRAARRKLGKATPLAGPP